MDSKHVFNISRVEWRAADEQKPLMVCNRHCFSSKFVSLSSSGVNFQDGRTGAITKRQSDTDSRPES